MGDVTQTQRKLVLDLRGVFRSNTSKSSVRRFINGIYLRRSKDPTFRKALDELGRKAKR